VQATLRSWFETDGSLRANFRLFLTVFAMYSPTVYSLVFVLEYFDLDFLFSSKVIFENLPTYSVFRLFLEFVIFNPVAEEYIFRYPALLAYRYSKIRFRFSFLIIMVVSSVAFAMVHSPDQLRFPIPQFLMGSAVFFIGSRTNIFYCMAFHMLNNSLALLIAELL
jgi:membrane protease YdiL (CAAX protease family)